MYSFAVACSVSESTPAPTVHVHMQITKHLLSYGCNPQGYWACKLSHMGNSSGAPHTAWLPAMAQSYDPQGLEIYNASTDVLSCGTITCKGTVLIHWPPPATGSHI